MIRLSLITDDIISVKGDVCMKIMYELCDRIAAFRNNLGITQAELAKKLNISRSAVNSWEMGTSTPQLKHVIEMAEIFHTTLDGMVTSSERVTVDITDLDTKEQQIIFNMVDCLKTKRDNNQS